MFHGAAGEDARETFKQQFQTEKVPTTLAGFDALTEQRDLFDTADVATQWREARRQRIEADHATPDLEVAS